MRKVAILALAGMLCLRVAYDFHSKSVLLASDMYIRDRVYKLYSDKGSCSGIEVKAPSGAVYILSAAHCADIAEDGRHMLAQAENDTSYTVEIVSKDEKTDLLLLSAPNMLSINVAKSVVKHQHVHTLTHGHGLMTYRTDGELMDQKELHIPFALMASQADADKCLAEEYALEQGPFGIKMCCHIVHSVISTAKVVPGSSGGPVLNDAGQLVGIVSNTDGEFSGFVSLEDIITFLKQR